MSDFYQRFSVKEYHRMCCADPTLERTELLRGEIHVTEKKTPQHCYFVNRLRECCQRVAGDDCYVRQENPITHGASDSELEPDIAIVRGSPQDHTSAHPTTADFIIEVAIASIELDRAKGTVYAEAGVPEFWIVLPEERAIEVYTSPAAEGYQQMRRHEDVNAPLATTVFPELAIVPRELFA